MKTVLPWFICLCHYKKLPNTGFKHVPAIIPAQRATLAEVLQSPPLFTHTDGKDGIMVGLSDNGKCN